MRIDKFDVFYKNNGEPLACPWTRGEDGKLNWCHSSCALFLEALATRVNEQGSYDVKVVQLACSPHFVQYEIEQDDRPK